MQKKTRKTITNSDWFKNYKFVPYLFVIFFAIIFAVDIFFVYVANKSWRGLATENSYQKGLKYNQTIEYVKKQQQLGWSNQIKYSKLAEKKGILTVKITDKHNNLIKDAKVTAKFSRPLQEGFDFALELKFDRQQQLYSSVINFPLKGQWDMQMQAAKYNIIYQAAERLIVY